MRNSVCVSAGVKRDTIRVLVSGLARLVWGMGQVLCSLKSLCFGVWGVVVG